MDIRTLNFTHKNNTKQLCISARSKHTTLSALVKRVFSLTSEIRFINEQGLEALPSEILVEQRLSHYSVVTDEEFEQSRSYSHSYSQKNMTRKSGRETPPSEKELYDSKFYIDDFQLFMTEISHQNTNLYGIIFFSNKKKAQFLGKKILRELIFDFDKIQFFYALHPIKRHHSSALLGDVLLFSLFRGRHMIFESEFGERVNAAQEITNYLYGLVKLGELNFNSNGTGPKNHKNLIDVHEQRSFDGNLEVEKEIKPTEIKLFGRSVNMQETRAPKEDIDLGISPIMKGESAIKSHITNQISFENEIYQPDWFFNGDKLTRLEKSFLTCLIRNNHQNTILFCQALQTLKNIQKQSLNVKLMKTYLGEEILKAMADLNRREMAFIYEQQEVRTNFIFSELLKLSKFGSIKDFIQAVKRHLRKSKQSSKQLKFTQVCSLIQNRKNMFSLRLKECGQSSELLSPTKPIKTLAKEKDISPLISEFADNFYYSLKEPLSIKVNIPSQSNSGYFQADIAHIQKLAHNQDPFISENFRVGSNYPQLSPKIVKKYMTSIEPRYSDLRSKFCKNEEQQLKIKKLEQFMSLLYYCYKIRLINAKQLKCFFYLYSWSDLNILGAFELYLEDARTDEFLDTLYSIDYQYYLNNRYGLDPQELESITEKVEIQISVQFILSSSLSIEERLAIEKWILSGDQTLYQLFIGYDDGNEAELIRKISRLAVEKRREYVQLVNSQQSLDFEQDRKKKERYSFVEQIKPVHFASFKEMDLIKDCIQFGDEALSSIFELYERTNQLTEWIQNFQIYIQQIASKHRNATMSHFAKAAELSLSKLEECKTEPILGIYEAYKVTRDKEDAIESLRRLMKKVS